MELNSIVIAPKIVVMVVSNVDTLDIANKLHCSEQTGVNCLTTDMLYPGTIDSFKVPHISKFRDRNMEESVAR